MDSAQELGLALISEPIAILGLVLHYVRCLPQVVEHLKVREIADFIQDARDQILPLAWIELLHWFRAASLLQRGGRQPPRTSARGS